MTSQLVSIFLEVVVLSKENLGKGRRQQEDEEEGVVEKEENGY